MKPAAVECPRCDSDLCVLLTEALTLDIAICSDCGVGREGFPWTNSEMMEIEQDAYLKYCDFLAVMNSLED